MLDDVKVRFEVKVDAKPRECQSLPGAVLSEQGESAVCQTTRLDPWSSVFPH